MLFATGLQAQQLGIYKWSGGYFGEEISFYEGQRFRYRFSTCTYGGEGIGHYEIVDSILTLCFEKDEIRTSDIYIDTLPTDRETIYLQVEVLDKKCHSPHLYPYQKEVILIDNSDGFLNRSIVNDQGKVEFCLPRSDQPVTLLIGDHDRYTKGQKIRKTTYGIQVDTNINPNSNLTITAELGRLTPFYYRMMEPGTEKTYTVIDTTYCWMKLRNNHYWEDCSMYWRWVVTKTDSTYIMNPACDLKR